MTLTSTVVNHTIKGLTRMVCRIDDHELKRIPPQGPMILVANHVNFLDAPMIYTHLFPRPLTGFVKAETWDNPLSASFLTTGRPSLFTGVNWILKPFRVPTRHFRITILSP